MSMTNQDEQIADQQATSEQTENQTQESVSALGQSENVGETPDKFSGKSAAEIAQAYRELEKERGRLAQELGTTRKEREEAMGQFMELQRAVSRYNSMPTQQPPAQQQVEDPFSSFDQLFEEDPKRAVKETLKRQQELLARQTMQQSLQQRQAEANEYYWNEKKSNQDYARREPLMQQLVAEYQDIIKPEYLNSVKALKALDLMSRGKDLDFYVKQAASTAQKNGSSVRDEKRRAQSESANSGGEQQQVDFSKLSSKEMAKYLKRSDDQIIGVTNGVHFYVV